MRIVAGRAGGVRLAVPKGGTRPTSERVREAMFSALGARIDDWSEVSVLDLYAGSGALGLEALSRGARRVMLVERDARACALIRRNIAAVGIEGAELRCADASTLAAQPPAGGFDLVLADPPYDVPAATVAGILERLAAAGWAAHGALAVVERPVRDHEPPWPPGWSGERRRDYGDTSLWYGHRARPT